MNKTVKRYIDQEEWISRLENELKETTNEQRRAYLNIWINAIKCQPTLNEKEIIRKTVERIVERLKMKLPTHWEHDAYWNGSKEAIEEAIEICKEEGGTSD